MALFIRTHLGISVVFLHASVFSPLVSWKVDSLGWPSVCDDWQVSWNLGTSSGWQVTAQTPGDELRLLQEVASMCYSLTCGCAAPRGGTALYRLLLLFFCCWTKQVTRPHWESAMGTPQRQGHSDGVSSLSFFLMYLFHKIYSDHFLSPLQTSLRSSSPRHPPNFMFSPNCSKIRQNKTWKSKQTRQKHTKNETKIPPNKHTPTELISEYLHSTWDNTLLVQFLVLCKVI